MLIIVYLVAIVAANLIIAKFGASMAIITAFVFIGLDLTSRDSLHEQWEHKHLWRNMALLIGVGSALSAVLNWQAAPIATASFFAFLLAGIADTITYQAMGGKTRLAKMNGSNLVSAAVDSLVFPALAFGLPIMWGIVIGQFVAKLAGGFLWSLVLTRTKETTVNGKV